MCVMNEVIEGIWTVTQHARIVLIHFNGPDPSGGRHLGLRWFAVCRRGRWRQRQRWLGVLAGALKTKPLHVMNSY